MSASDVHPALPLATGGTLRLAAARVLGELLAHGRNLDVCLAAHQQEVEPRDLGLLRELCYGVARWYHALAFISARLLTRPLARQEYRVRALLALGLYQLLHTRIPAHAAVASTVAAAHALGKPWAPGLVNAVLRSFLRRQGELLAELAHHPAATSAHPQWLFHSLHRDWPSDAAAILAANNTPAPLTLRVNLRRTSVAAYLATLAQRGIAAQLAPATQAGITLAEAVAVNELPGFAEGLASVQDGAAQLAAPLLALYPGQRVLDACAAPGGKTAHSLELEPGIELLALDQDAERLGLLEGNLKRLGLSATTRLTDASEPSRWWDGRGFDRILLDAPCTASGVIRRHPDIKLLRRPEDSAAFAQRQGQLLAQLWPTLAPNGRLLYATCSVLRVENDRVIEAFLAAHSSARVHPIAAAWGVITPYGRQILPGEQAMDGFYYACLGKTA